MTKKKQIIFSSLLGIVLLGVIFWPKHREVEPLDEVDVTDSVEVQEIVYKYGIPIDDYDVDFGVVGRNQNLSSILDRHGVGKRKVYQLTEASKMFLMSGRSEAGRLTPYFPAGIVCRR